MIGTGAKPRDEIETMLLAQMAAVHISFMTYSRHLNVRPSIYDQNIAERALNRLARTYFQSNGGTAAQPQRRGKRSAEQQVSVAAGGQAIVGSIMQAPSEMAS